MQYDTVKLKHFFGVGHGVFSPIELKLLSIGIVLKFLEGHISKYRFHLNMKQITCKVCVYICT